MKKYSSVNTSDPGMRILNDILASRDTSIKLDVEENTGTIGNQNYIIQYDEIIQSFDTGILCVIGMISELDKESNCAKLDPKVMKNIDYWDLKDRESDIDVFKYIQLRHKSEGIKISDEIMKGVVREVDSKAYNDKTGLLLSVSPYLSGLNALINVYIDQTMTKLIIYVDNHKVRQCHEVVKRILKKCFIKSKKTPIYIEFSDISFNDFIIGLTKNYSVMDDLDGSVVMTTDRNFIESTAKNPKIKNVSVVFPVSKSNHLTEELPAILHLIKPECEYVGYKNNPLKSE